MMGREITYTDLDDETSYTMRQDKCKALSGIQMSRFMNSLHRVFGQSLGVLPSNLISASHPPGSSNYPPPRGFSLDYTNTSIHEVQQRLRRLQPFRNDIGYFPTADFQYSQCQEHIPEFYLSWTGAGGEQTGQERRTPSAPMTGGMSLQQPPALQYSSPPGMYTFLVPVYPCYILIPAVQQAQNNMRT